MKAKLTLNGKEYEVEINEEQVKEIEKPKWERWRAEKNEKYYFLSDLGEIFSATDCRDKSDNFLYNTDNYFKTEEGAEEYRKKLLYRQQYIDYIGEDLVTKDDWKDGSVWKYYAYYDFYNRIIKFDYNFNTKDVSIHSKSKEKIENFINLIGEDNFKKYILEVEE